MAEQTKDRQGLGGLVDELPTDRLKDGLRDAGMALMERAAQSAVHKVEDTTERLTDYASTEGGPGLMAALRGAQEAGSGGSPVKGALKGALSGVGQKVKEALGGGGGGGSTVKVTNIVENIDVGVPVSVAYNQWTQFQDWTGFMKKVEGAEQKSDEKLNMKARIFFSHRAWDATIIEQVPDDRIVWRSSGQKGYVDGTVTFHELGPRLTRILVVLEYHPQGLFEKTGNLWRSQGRRARLELKHFRRHVMTKTILDPDSVEGWRGEIRDSEVVTSHEDAVAEEDEASSAEDEPEDEESRSEDSARAEDEESEDEEDEEYDDEEVEDEREPVDEYEEERADEDEVPEDEDTDGGGRRGGRAKAGSGRSR